MKSTSECELFGVTKIARIVGKSEDTIRDLERRGIITAVRDSANRRQFNADQVSVILAHYAKGATA
jgi:DNA-binding transcriptional MerR regulator